VKHRLLLRQLKSLGLSVDNPPANQSDWQEFLARIERAYSDADQERYLLERSLEISSQEMQERFRMLEEERSRSTHASKMAALGEMAGGMAHEINNPVAVLQTLASQGLELIEDGDLDPSWFKASFQKMVSTSSRIAKIVQGLRTFSRESGGDPFTSSVLADVVNDTLVFCLERFRHNAVEFRYTPADPSIRVECRPSQVSQVLLNLLNNAYDAVSPLGEKWISLEVVLQGDQVELLVTDSGRGVPEAVRQKVFQPFFTTKAPGKGTGLGLSLAKGILDAHGGSLHIDADCPNTRFVVRIPLKHGQTKVA
jgi:C4-dicarboxylate-specific signal transduction histidine kinase